MTCRIIPLFQDYLMEVDIAESKASFVKGRGGLYTVTAVITEPMADLEFGVFQPLGYNVRDRRPTRCIGIN